MNYLDIIISVPLLYGLIKGFSNGLVKEVTAVIALFIGVYVAINFSEYLEPKFTEILDGYKQFVPVLAFGVLFLVSVLFIKALGSFIDKLTKALALGVFSRLFGAVFGFSKVIIIFSFLLFFIKEYKLVNKQTKDGSVLFEPLTDLAKIVVPKLQKHKSILEKIDEEAKKAKQKIEQKINF